MNNLNTTTYTRRRTREYNLSLLCEAYTTYMAQSEIPFCGIAFNPVQCMLHFLLHVFFLCTDNAVNVYRRLYQLRQYRVCTAVRRCTSRNYRIYVRVLHMYGAIVFSQCFSICAVIYLTHCRKGMKPTTYTMTVRE